MGKLVEELKQHNIVCGYGRIGKIIVQELSRCQLAFVVIENDKLQYDLLEESGIPAVLGDATSDEVLERAGIKRARCLIVVTREDSDNLYITLSARALNPDIYIISRAADEANEPKFRRAGANKVISPYRIGGMIIAQSAIRPNVIDFVEITTQTKGLEYSLEEMLVESGATVCNKTLSELALGRSVGVIVVGIRRQEKMIFNPSAETEIKPNDILIVLGSPAQLAKLEHLLSIRARA